MSREMAHKLIVPQKKNYVPNFLKQRYIGNFMSQKHIIGHFEGFFEGAETFLTPKLSIFTLNFHSMYLQLSAIQLCLIVDIFLFFADFERAGHKVMSSVHNV